MSERKIKLVTGKFRGKRIGVLVGGPSGEREVSLRSGAAVKKALESLDYDVVAIDAGANLVGQLKDARVDVVVNALHGTFGEDGTVQGVLESARVPYTGSGIAASAVTMDKVLTKRLLLEQGIPTPAYFYCEDLKEGQEIEPLSFPFPVVVKPNREGSSLGISICHRADQLSEAVSKALEWHSGLLIEAFIPGRELTVGVLKPFGHDVMDLPLVEIVPKREFYDYQAKYTKGASEYFCPAQVDSQAEQSMREMARRAYEICHCRGSIRVDFRLNPENKPFVIEINTSPGMTELSLLPMAAKAAGLGFADLVELNLESAALELRINWA